MSETIRAAVHEELCRVEEDLLHTEKAHFAAAELDSGVHLVVGLAATVSSATAATTLIGDSAAWIPGVFALVATVASTILTFLKPDKRAAQHLQSGRALGALRVRVRQQRMIELVAPGALDASAWTSKVHEFGKQKADIEGAAPPIGEWAFQRARKKIQRGDFTHHSVPL